MTPSLSEWFVRISFGLTGVIHVLPLAGVLGRSTLERAYGVTLGEGQDLTILMQHRAILFGLLAAACFAAMFNAAWRWPVGIAALISMIGFVLFAALQTHGAAVAKVMWVDVGAALLLSIGLIFHSNGGR